VARKVRRVVTGRDADGKSVFVSDDHVDATTIAISPGSEFHQLWGGDAVPPLPIDGTEPAHTAYFPPPGGFRFNFFTVPPASTEFPADLDINAALVEMEEKLPGMGAHMEPEDPGMHTTDTIDFEVMLSGEVVLELDDGAEKTIRPGDVVVQNGTRHRWINRTKEPAVFAAFMCGARRAN
jgi:mannose-6-phosphate isomerase-like protein (cupin superfamily)